MAEELNPFGGTSVPGIPINGVTGGRVMQISGDVLFAGNVEIRAGRFIAATEDSATLEPTDANFSGCFMSAEGETFGDSTYNIGGVNAGVLQFGLDATDGKAYFMGGAAVMDDGGVFLNGLGTLLTLDATEAGVTRHATIGMEVPAGGTAPAMTLKSYEPTLGASLITNGTFEGDTPGDPPANWTVQDSLAGVAVRAASGSFTSQYLEIVTDINSDGAIRSDQFSVTAGETYYISAKFECDVYLSVSIHWFDEGGNQISLSWISTSFPPGWNSTTSAICPTGAVTACIQVRPDYKVVSTSKIDDILVQTMSGTTNVGNIRLSPFMTVDGLATFNDGIAGALTGNVTGDLTGAVNSALITLTEGSDPSSPSAGYRALYAKSDGVYQKTSGGTVSRLALASEIPTLTYPKRFAVMGDEITTAKTSWAFSAVDVQLYNGIWSTTTADATNGDEFTFGVYLAAGTYTFYHMGRSQTDAGKIDWYVDGSSVATGRDWYAASAAFKIDSFSVTVATSGYHTVLMKVNGKNGSSSDYRVIITKIWGKQAAD